MPHSSGGSKAGARFQYVSGSFIQTVAPEPVPFPGRLERDGSPAPHMLRAFIRQSQLSSQQARLDARGWNNLGYAYASLPTPDFLRAASAFTRARGLTQDEELLQVIQHNLGAATLAQRKLVGDATPATLSTVRWPPLRDIGIQYLRLLRGDFPLGTKRSGLPKASTLNRGKKPGSKGPGR